MECDAFVSNVYGFAKVFVPQLWACLSVTLSSITLALSLGLDSYADRYDARGPPPQDSEAGGDCPAQRTQDHHEGGARRWLVLRWVKIPNGLALVFLQEASL